MSWELWALLIGAAYVALLVVIGLFFHAADKPLPRVEKFDRWPL